MRSVMAMPLSHCDMANSGTSQNSAHNTGSNTLMSDYPAAHDMMSMATSSNGQNAENSHACCSGKSSCTDNCDMRISVSLLMQKSSYNPNFTNITRSVVLIPDPVKKEYTPPFRPPLVSLS